MKLIKEEWWIPQKKLVTDSNGEIYFTGFFGEYKLSCVGKQKPFSIFKEETSEIIVEL
jgi:hypothetical protein